MLTRTQAITLNKNRIKKIILKKSQNAKKRQHTHIHVQKCKHRIKVIGNTIAKQSEGEAK